MIASTQAPSVCQGASSKVEFEVFPIPLSLTGGRLSHTAVR